MAINWTVVALRIADGFLYGTGFVMALVIWLGFIKALPAKKQATGSTQPTTSAKE